MQYDQESGIKSGGGDFLSEGGAHICEIVSAIYTQASTGSHGIEFEVKTSAGLKGRYLKSYYAKKDNTPVAGGKSLMDAMMGILGLQSLSFVAGTHEGANVNRVPEFEGKSIGLFLQKKLYSKTNGGDGYSFEIKVPFNAADGKTLRETLSNSQAQTIERLSSSYADKDERTAQNGGGASASFYPASQYPDEI